MFLVLNLNEDEFSDAHTYKNAEKLKIFLTIKLSDIVFIMLINVKMSTNSCCHFNIFDKDQFHAQLSKT